MKKFGIVLLVVAAVQVAALLCFKSVLWLEMVLILVSTVGGLLGVLFFSNRKKIPSRQKKALGIVGTSRKQIWKRSSITEIYGKFIGEKLEMTVCDFETEDQMCLLFIPPEERIPEFGTYVGGFLLSKASGMNILIYVLDVSSRATTTELTAAKEIKPEAVVKTP